MKVSASKLGFKTVTNCPKFSRLSSAFTLACPCPWLYLKLIKINYKEQTLGRQPKEPETLRHVLRQMTKV